MPQQNFDIRDSGFTGGEQKKRGVFSPPKRSAVPDPNLLCEGATPSLAEISNQESREGRKTISFPRRGFVRVPQKKH